MMLRIYPKLISVLLIVWLIPLETANGQVQVIDGRQHFMKEYLIPAAPQHIVAEAPGRVWFTLPDANAIGSLAVESTAVYTEYSIPTPGSEPYALAYADGAIWFSERAGNRIGRLDIATGDIDEFPIPTADSEPTGIGIAPDGRVWFVGRSGNQIGRLDPSTGVIEEYIYQTPDAHFEGIAVANNKAVWATAPNLNQVVYLDLSRGTPLFSYVFSNPHPRPMGIVLDPGGNPWVAPAGSDYIIRYAPGTLSLWRPYRLAAVNSEPVGIAFRENGSIWELWFTEHAAGRAGQLRVRSSAAQVSLREARLPAADARPAGIAVDADGRVWVADSQGSTIIEWSAPYFHFAHLPLVHQQ
ncbi:MAG: hypothetical protein DCC55_04290 [Chloroflexi bacterium]|nr:MAG: hypothetical protein DCC55_04290 [Chloroflexota bacterium]